MLTSGTLDAAFAVYWDDMQRCREAKAYWSLLHVTACLPDICAALQTDTGDTSGKNRTLYVEWCDRYLSDPKLTGVDRYEMRCKVLHQGRAQSGPTSQYGGFAFVQPAPTGEVYHRRIEPPKKLVLDVGVLADEVRAGVGRWINDLESNPQSHAALNTERNLDSLVRVRRFVIPPGPGSPPGRTGPTILRTS